MLTQNVWTSNPLLSASRLRAIEIGERPIGTNLPGSVQHWYAVEYTGVDFVPSRSTRRWTSVNR
jgi:hypothetical protein